MVEPAHRVTDGEVQEAGYFAGDVTITGNLTLNGMKSAAVPFPDGSRRLLYCMESPELWCRKTMRNGVGRWDCELGWRVMVCRGWH